MVTYDPGELTLRLIVESPVPIEMPDQLPVKADTWIGYGRSITTSHPTGQSEQVEGEVHGSEATGPQPSALHPNMEQRGNSLRGLI